MSSHGPQSGPGSRMFACLNCGGKSLAARVWIMGFQEVDLVADGCGGARVSGVSTFTEMVYDEERQKAVLCIRCEYDVSVPAGEVSADLDLNGGRAALLARAIEACAPASASLS